MTLVKLRVSVLQVNALVHAVNSFPDGMPKRWSLISQLVSMVDESIQLEEAAYIHFDINTPGKKGNCCIVIIVYVPVWLIA